jgi:hypothetical protein
MINLQVKGQFGWSSLGLFSSLAEVTRFIAVIKGNLRVKSTFRFLMPLNIKTNNTPPSWVEMKV